MQFAVTRGSHDSREVVDTSNKVKVSVGFEMLCFPVVKKLSSCGTFCKYQCYKQKQQIETVNHACNDAWDKVVSVTSQPIINLTLYMMFSIADNWAL